MCDSSVDGCCVIRLVIGVSVIGILFNIGILCGDSVCSCCLECMMCSWFFVWLVFSGRKCCLCSRVFWLM